MSEAAVGRIATFAVYAVIAALGLVICGLMHGWMACTVYMIATGEILWLPTIISWLAIPVVGMLLLWND